MQDEDKFKKMFTALSERHNQEVFPALSQMLWDSLKPFDDQACIAAFQHVFQHGRFFKDLIPDLFEVLEKGNSKQIASNAQIEVDKILCHFRQYGGSRHPELADPVSKHLMSNRWPYSNWASTVLESEIKWWQREFIEAYNAYNVSDVKPEIEYHDSVAGLIEGIG